MFPGQGGVDVWCLVQLSANKMYVVVASISECIILVSMYMLYGYDCVTCSLIPIP